MYPLAINGIIIIPFVYCILQLDKTLYLCNIWIISATRKAIKFNQLARHVDPKFYYFRLMISTVKPWQILSCEQTRDHEEGPQTGSLVIQIKMVVIQRILVNLGLADFLPFLHCKKLPSTHSRHTCNQQTFIRKCA